MGIAHKKALSLKQIVVLFLIFFATMNFLSKYFYFIFAAFICCVFFQRRHLRIDGIALVLLMFSMSYICFFSETRESVILVLKSFAYPICYLMGLNYIGKYDYSNQTRVEKQMRIAVIVVSMGAFIHFLLNMLINKNSMSRNTIDIWTGEEFGATGQAALAIMAAGVFAAIIFSEYRLKHKFYAGIGLLIIMLYNLVLAGRTLVIASVITMLICFAFNIYNRGTNYSRKSILAVIISVSALFIIYFKDYFGIRTLILGSNLSTRFDTAVLLEDYRLTYRIQYLERLFKYPFGDGEIFHEVGSYAHELYLDVYSDVGIIGVSFLLLFIIVTLRNTYKIIIDRRVSINTRTIFLGLMLALHLEFLVEPILAGMPWLFCSYCFFQGIIKNFQDSIEYKKKNENITDQHFRQ